MRKAIRCAILVAISLSVLPVVARAQDTATITGTVMDQSGAVVPSAAVVVSNVAKGYVRNLVSDSAGVYIAAKIPIGNYTITATASGFRRLVQTGITVNVGQTLRVDLHLTVGSTTQEVSVHGNATKVETDTASISDVVTGTQVENLNLNARNFTNLAILVPGAAPGNYDPTTVGVLGGATVSFNGVRATSNNWEIDGANDTDEGAGGTAETTYPNIDSIAEFRITTNAYDASYGKKAGATVEVATKSGTQQFHGDLFEFVRNDAMDANDWFVNRQIAPPGGNAPKRPLKRNDFGFTLGGPIYIPHYYNSNKTKTFFFWSEEWRKNREGTIINAGVPTTRMRGGDFSECDSSSPNFNPVVASGCLLPTNPSTGQPFAGDIVPVDANANALIAALVPLPNNGVDGFVAAKSLPTNFREDQIRVDENLTDKTSVFVRYTQDAYEQDFVPTLWSSASFDTVKTLWTAPSKSAVFHLTHTFKPNLMNEFIMGFSADVNTVNNFVGPSSPAGSIDRPTGFSMQSLWSQNANQPLLPGISVSGGLPFSFAESTGFQYFYWGPVTTWKDNAMWTLGTHTLKFGFFLQHAALNQTVDSGYTTQGFLSFSDGASNTTGNALADMYLGRIANYSEMNSYGLMHYRQWAFEPYFQDDWRVTRKLTLNIGVRYDHVNPYHDVIKPTTDIAFLPNLYDPTKQAQLDASGNLILGSGQTYLTYGNGMVQCGAGAVPTGCMYPSHGTVAPRFGFAFDPTGSGRTVIRGGYGMFFDTSNGNSSAASFFGNPPTAITSNAYNITGYQNIVPGPYGPAYLNVISPHQGWPSMQQFSLGFQHQFPGNNFLGVNYVGTLGRHLNRSRNLDQVPIGVGTENVPALAGTPGCDSAGNCDVQNILINNLEPSIFFVPYRGFNAIAMRENTGISSYNSLQVNYRHPVGHGLMFQAAYTWSHTIDNLSVPGINDYDLSRWRSTSSINQAQVLTLNYVYSLPLFAHATNSFLRNGLGGWKVSGITTFFTGLPISFNCGIAGLSTGIGGNVMCNSLGKVQVKKGVFNDPQFGPTATWFDPSVIGQVTMAQLSANGQPGMFGYMGLHTLTGPGRNDWDLALLKDFQAPWFSGEHSTVQFRLETFNTFNHPQWQSVNAFCSGQTPPGQPCNGTQFNLGNGEVSGAWPARILQLGLKFVF